jgi:Aromatic acid exporter family member 1
MERVKVRDRLGHELRRLREDRRASLSWALRITAAAVASYVVAILIFPGTQPLLAPLTAMLVVQVTPVSLLASGLDRVVAVVTGVALAIGFAAVTPLEWWSLGLLIFVSIVIGQVLRLRDNLIEVAISGMLVLGVGSLGAGSAAWQRITETLVGAGVGIAANLLLPPKVASADAARAVDGLADAISALLNRAAEELVPLVEDRGDLGPSTRRWLDEARRITHDETQWVGSALARAEEGRRLNVRAVGTPDVGPGLRQGFEALEHVSITVRGMFRALADAASELDWGADEVAPDVLLGIAQTFRELAAGVDSFGQLVRNEAGPPTTMTADDVRTLRDALDGLHEARARLEELLANDISPALGELSVVMLSTVRRVLREMDLEQRVRRQVQMTRPTRPRPAYLSRPRSRRRPVAQEVSPDAETQPMPRLPE